jgi:hypothetical protein
MGIPSISGVGAWVGLFAAVSAVAIVSVTAYRLFFHPLASVPGPALAAVTRLYAFYFNIIKGGTFYLEIERLHKVYGMSYAWDIAPPLFETSKTEKTRARGANCPK